ncbi:PspC domain-containing protein [Pseudoflavitalea sp. G-6-1-2]|uniref:PspC domain-containing protein n=1 Tax=Pseudoflavitalea sp. G-6-1-2 TaxID=2728841 RepID=UPI001980FECE|nr:PspC domain-containing protein [Pseudoflavitalea sp. G-6-1-2]
MLIPVNRFRQFIEWQAFGVCTAMGDRLGIAATRIRTWFVYISFLTMGSPLIVYFVLAFWMNMKRYILSGRRNPLKYQ